MELRDRLAEIAGRGGPAQAEHARKLLEQLERSDVTDAAVAEASDLINAYLHDPYLTKNAGD